MIRLTPPIRFLGAVMLGWIGLRVVFWSPLLERERLAIEALGPMLGLPADFGASAPARGRAADRRRAPAGGPVTVERRSDRPILRADLLPMRAQAAAARFAAPLADSIDPLRRAQLLFVAFAPSAAQPMLMRLAPVRPATPFQAPAPLAAPSPWRFSAWTLWRNGGGDALATGGQLGGSQAGIRARYRLGRLSGAEVALAARLSRPIETRGAEAAIGLSTQPLRGLPVELAFERRIAIEPGGRDAWALGAAGGVDRQPLALGFELDAYAQAGVVGAPDRDLYGDAALTVGRPLALGERTRLTLGGGLWASAQPGTARVDIGPQATMRVPSGDRALRIQLGWRQRIAGGAEPGSGPVLTLGTDF